MPQNKQATAARLTRRSAVLGLAGTALAGATLRSPPGARADFNLELEPPLRSRTRASGIRYGCAGAAPIVQPDRILLEKFAIEANIFSPEGALKWIQTEPLPGKFDFAEGDSIAAFAARNDMLMHGHTLVWYTANPDWVANLRTGQAAQAALERHINVEVSHYRRKIWAWDVVNEAIEPDDRLAEDYRDSVWLRCLGAGYIDLAFRLTRAVDPQVPLCLSEYGIEYVGPKPRRRRAALLALLRKLREQNTPVDCLSLQSHLEAHQTFDRAELTGFLREVVKLGYHLMITELDVNDCRIGGSPDQRDRATARHLAEYLDIVFAVAKPLSIATWGLSDRSTWLRQYWKRADGSPLRPLPLDADLKRKPMWAVLARYLAGQERQPT
ncbi:MAG: endo-1,4-beta-xylanase [Hyphomicrobiales bacterium]|nr:endo-1,4-beta-xylanase [Hyphomicrobiales bacterium]